MNEKKVKDAFEKMLSLIDMKLQLFDGLDMDSLSQFHLGMYQSYSDARYYVLHEMNHLGLNDGKWDYPKK